MLFEYHEPAMHYALSGKPLAQNYPLADPDCYEAVQSAVFHVLARMYQQRLPQPMGSNGRFVYRVRSRDGVPAQLFVLRLGARLASLQLTPLMPLDPIQLIIARQHPLSETAQLDFGYLFATCHEAIVEFVRTTTIAEGYDPPPPPGDIEQLVLWASMYAAGKPDKQLAWEHGVAVSTLRNARHSMGLTKRPQSAQTERTPRE